MGASLLLAVPVGADVTPISSTSGPPAQASTGLTEVPVCGAVPVGYSRCFVHVVENSVGNSKKPSPPPSSPSGLSPSQIIAAYDFPGAGNTNPGGSGKTIAIVDAYNDPTVVSDLGTFDTQFKLAAPPSFSVVNQSGQSSPLPSNNSNWALEISLDVQWAHAIAPAANILLVEANSNQNSDLYAAVSYAATKAQYVSMSWGGSEYSGETTADASTFGASGVSYFAAAGDSGLPAEYPSSSPKVISVGGTTLQFDSSGNVTAETGWSSGGGGCSAYESATSAQSTFLGSSSPCASGVRATPDVSLDADPNSGVAVYDSTPYNGQSGWFKVGGTSVATPLWAARSAVAGTTVDSSYVYGGGGIVYRDANSGNNGAACLIGYDLCTGRGSWTGGGATNSLTPTAPLDLGATINGSGQIELSWSPPQDGGAATYTVWRGTSSSSITTQVGTTTSPTTTLVDATALSGTTYYYDVTATDPSGTGPASNVVSEGIGTTTTATTDTVSSIVYTSGTNLNINVTVTDNLGHAVSGASVSITVYLNGALYGSATGTTNTSGVAGFVARNAPSGTYNTVVTSVSGAGLTWDGKYPANSFTR